MELTYFKNINLKDPFFDSLKEDYPEFPRWFAKKSNEQAQAYVHKTSTNTIDGFLYLKLETEEIKLLSLNNIVITKPAIKRLKIGTFKVHPHKTKLGDRFISKIVYIATQEQVKEIYITIFDKHEKLIELVKHHKFTLIGRSIKSTINGREGYYFRES